MKLQKDANALENIAAEQNDLGIQPVTHILLGKFWDDMLHLENELEKHRKYKLSQINIKDCFRCLDLNRNGYATLEDYYNFFE